MPPVVTGWLLLLLFGAQGPIGAPLARLFHLQLAFTREGAALACAVMIFPLMVRPIRLAIGAIDPRLAAAARTLGAGRFDRFASITLPLAAPGILLALVLGYTASLGEFGAVITFCASIPGETRTLPLAIFAALQQPGGEHEAAMLSLISLALATAGIVLSEIAAGGRGLRFRAASAGQ